MCWFQHIQYPPSYNADFNSAIWDHGCFTFPAFSAPLANLYLPSAKRNRYYRQQWYCSMSCVRGRCDSCCLISFLKYWFCNYYGTSNVSKYHWSIYIKRIANPLLNSSSLQAADALYTLLNCVTYIKTSIAETWANTENCISWVSTWAKKKAIFTDNKDQPTQPCPLLLHHS